MSSPISKHTFPWPEAGAARYVAAGYWAGIPIGRLPRQVAGRSASARALAGAHVAGHVARNAEALVRLVTLARTGVENPMYAGPGQWAAEIEASAGRPAAILRADIITSASALDDALGLLDGDTWKARIRSAQGHEIPARKVNLHAIR
jgi:maleylpyruvate isomerase